MTVLELATRALQSLGVLAAGETPAPEDAALVLARLNSLIDQWATERLTIYTVTRSTWAIVSGTAAYSVGGVRPTFLNGISYTDSAQEDLETPLTILSEAQYQGIGLKAFESVYPTAAYYNPTHPLGTITLWPVPTAATLTGVIYLWNPVTEFAELSDLVALPPGYRRFLETNVAVEVAPDFERSPSALLIRAARESKDAVKRSNHRLMDLIVETPFMSHHYDIEAGP